MTTEGTHTHTKPWMCGCTTGPKPCTASSSSSSDRIFSPEAQAKASNLSLSCLSLALITAYNELGTGIQSQDRWLYGPGQIITLCGLALPPSENGKDEKRKEQSGIGGQRLKIHTPTFEENFATQPPRPEFTTDHCLRSVPRYCLQAGF